MAWIYVSTKVDTHQEQAMHSDRSRKLSKAGWVRLRGGGAPGMGDRAYMDVLSAPPPPRPTPPTPREPRLGRFFFSFFFFS
ncbi:hypothetical protein A7X56_19785 [Stenotrophomonas maltophilia]|nr:hypothetical protein A7X56_19785 [Stenotrophomonas maltophilia]